MVGSLTVGGYRSPATDAPPSSVQGVDHDETERLYGPWAARTPDDAVDLFEGYAGRWWIAGGWAIDAFTGVRPHGDLAHPGHPWSLRI